MYSRCQVLRKKHENQQRKSGREVTPTGGQKFSTTSLQNFLTGSHFFAEEKFLYMKKPLVHWPVANTPLRYNGLVSMVIPQIRKNHGSQRSQFVTYICKIT